MTDEQKELWLEGAELFGDAVENRNLVPVMQEDEIDFTVSMPAIKYDKDPSVYSSAKPDGFRQVYWKTFWNKIMEGYNMAVNATSDLTDLKTLINAAIEAATTAAEAADTAATDADNVDASLVGMTVTITGRDGVSRSTNIGFEIYRTYASVALMNADAANVPEGKFVMIATTDPTSVENARLYGRNGNAPTSAEPFNFLSDLDQASSSAWAEWLNTYKPSILQAIQNANDAAANANTKAQLAQTAATNADNSRIAIEANEQQRQTNESARVQAETQRQTDWTNFFSDTLSTGCRKLWNDFWSLVNTSWTGFWGTSASDPNGVRKQWADLSADALTATSNANNAAGLANEKAGLADDNAALANDKASLANEKAGYAQTQGDYAKNMADHPMYIADGSQARPGDYGYVYYWDYTTQAYVKGDYMHGDDLHWNEMTPEEKEELEQAVLSHIAFDDAPTKDSMKAVRSGGIYTALQGKQDTLDFATKQEAEEAANELT